MFKLLIGEKIVTKHCPKHSSPNIVTNIRHQTLSQIFVTKHYHKYSSPNIITNIRHQTLSQTFVTKHCHNHLSPNIVPNICFQTFVTKHCQKHLSPNIVTNICHQTLSETFVTKYCHKHSSPNIITNIRHQTLSQMFVTKHYYKYSSPNIVTNIPCFTVANKNDNSNKTSVNNLIMRTRRVRLNDNRPTFLIIQFITHLIVLVTLNLLISFFISLGVSQRVLSASLFTSNYNTYICTDLVRKAIK